MRKLLLLILLLITNSYASGADALSEKRDSILRGITGAIVPKHRVPITKFGAKGDGLHDCRKAFEKAMLYARKHGGACIEVPAGEWVVKGPIHLVDNVCLELMEGCVLKFDAQPQFFLPMVETCWEGTYLWNYSPFIYGKGVRNVAITGRGTIDCSSAAESFATWDALQDADQQLSRDYNHRATPIAERQFGEGHYLRPPLIQLYDCQGVTLSDVLIHESPFWCVHILRSENVVCRGLRYDAKLVNNDGIDIESTRNVLIEGVCFNNGDDNIAIKSGRDNDGWTMNAPSAGIIVRNCHFKGLHGVVVGSEMSGGVEDVFIEDCDYSGYCKRGIFLKTNPDRGGYVRNISVRNCSFGEVFDLFYVTSMYAGQGLSNHHFSTIEGLFVDGLSAQRVAGTALVLQGTEARPIRNVQFRNVSVGSVQNGLSFEHTEPVLMQHCALGPKVEVPSTASALDNLFGRDDKRR